MRGGGGGGTDVMVSAERERELTEIGWSERASVRVLGERGKLELAASTIRGGG